MEIVGNTRVITDSIRLIETSKNYKTRVARCSDVIRMAEKMVKYEKKGIVTISPSPKTVIRDFTKRHDDILLEEIQEIIKKSQAKADLASSVRTKVTALNSARLKVLEVGESLKNTALLKPHESALKTAAHKAELQGYLDAASKAEFKGNKKKAIDQYQEALYFLKNDDVPDDLQRSEIVVIEAKIRELQK